MAGFIAFVLIFAGMLAADVILGNKDEEKARICKMADESRRNDAIKNQSRRKSWW